jgi:hypothetical protein
MSTDTPKKIIPKFKKKLQGFLSDESGKITKEDVLKMGMIAMGIAGITGVNDVNAAHASNYSGVSGNSHSNGQGGNCHGNGAWSYGNTVNGHANASGTAWANCYGGTASHGNVSHSSAHGNHSSGGWC